MSVEDSHHYEAVQLFLERAKRARLDFFQTEETLPHVVGICRLVGGSPLGIELAAVWIKVMSVLEIREEIARNLAFLETTTRNIPERHRSIEAAFEYSWNLLTPREQEVLRNLSVFTGGFRKEAASLVVGATLPVLVSLVDKSLLSASPGGRYDRHPLLYQFTSEKLAQHPGEHTEFQERHARYFLELIQERHQDLGTPRHKETLAVFEEELGNIRTAWRWLVEGVRSSEIRQYATALSELYQNHTQEAAEVFAETAAVLDEADPEQQAALGYVLIERGEYLFFLTRFEEAIGLAQRGLGLLRPLGEVLGILRGLLVVGRAHQPLGNLVETKRNWEEGLELARKHDIPRQTARFLMASTIALRDLDPSNPQHLDDGWEVLAEMRELGSLDYLITHLVNFGYYLLGHRLNPREAEPLFVESLQLARKLGLQWPLPFILAGLARIKYELYRNYHQVQALLLEGREIAEERGDKWAMTGILNASGEIAMAHGDYSQARQHLHQHLRVAWESNISSFIFQGIHSHARLHARQGNVRRALEWLSLVLHHPAISSNQILVVQRSFDEVRERVPEEVLTAATERGKTMNLDAVVKEILEGT